MIETALVYGSDHKILHWHLPAGRTGGSIPDSPDLWNVLWDNRRLVMGVAHSHPGTGVPSPSWTDLTTFAAIESGLGKRLYWPILSEDSYTLVEWEESFSCYSQVQISDEPPWAYELRLKSGYRILEP